MKEWKIKKFNLDDLYVRFFRLAERRITERDMPGKGVLCYISNFSYLSDPSFLVMRKRFLDEFDGIWIDCLNGDSRETGKLTPEGKPDPSIFSTELNPEGIRVGTAIGMMVKRSPNRGPRGVNVHFRQFWGTQKREKLVASLSDDNLERQYQAANPQKENRYSFRPATIGKAYQNWPKITDLSAISPMNGLMEKRGGALIDYSKSDLESRLRAYFDPGVDWDSLRAISPKLTSNAGRFEARKARKKIQDAETFSPSRLVRYALRPFDNKWAYYSPIRPLWNEPRPDLWHQYVKGNHFLMTRPAGVAHPEGVPIFFTKNLGDNDFLRGHAYYIPWEIKGKPQQHNKGKLNQSSLLPEEEQPVRMNLSEKGRQYLAGIEARADAAKIWLHALAVGCSSGYLRENADGIRQDWPRIPLPDSAGGLHASAELGSNIASLFDTESPVKGVTAGEIRAELRHIGVTTRVGGGSLKESDLALTAGWGHAGKDGVTMPGKGKLVERQYSHAERKALLDGGSALGLSEKQLFEHLGEKTCDVYLNDIAYWSDIPARVWDYTIGGYQVIKKWLSYREHKILGRTLTKEEVRYVQEMARRIAAILLLEPSLEANYRAVKADTYSWPT